MAPLHWNPGRHWRIAPDLILETEKKAVRKLAAILKS
jgi:hypothetical protein